MMEEGEGLKGWLFEVGRNRCLDELGGKHAIHFSELEKSVDDDEQLALADMPDISPLPEEVAERHDLQQILLKAIQELPPKFRAVVLLRYASQLSYAEIGQVLNIPAATAN